MEKEKTIQPVQKKDNKYIITLFKGQSLANPDEYESNKLIMLRLAITVVGNVSKYAKIPDKYKDLVDVVRTTDLDIEIIVKFLEKKMDRKEIVKFFSTIVDVYKVAKPGEKIGELEMDEALFKEFMDMLQYLMFDTVKNNAVF